MESAFKAWIGQPVVLQVALGDIKVPLRGKLLKDGTDTVRVRIGDGWDVDIYKTRNENSRTQVRDAASRGSAPRSFRAGTKSPLERVWFWPHRGRRPRRRDLFHLRRVAPNLLAGHKPHSLRKSFLRPPSQYPHPGRPPATRVFFPGLSSCDSMC